MAALVVGYFLYGHVVERVFAPDDRPTPANTRADGVDYVLMPRWRVFMVQFLNIAGTGPIFGAILGAKFGPSCFLWIVFGSIFAGGVHDYLTGMLSMRHGGESLPGIVGRYLGRGARAVMLVFSVFLLLMVGVVFVDSPAEILTGLCGSFGMWVALIMVYYVIATLLPVDKLIGRVYPLFAFSLLFMTVALAAVLLMRMPAIPELWDGLQCRGFETSSTWKDTIFPCLFITVACGAISGFHATQSPIMARCLGSERDGRRIFYGAMIAEGMVALVWAAVASYFFYGSPVPASAEIAETVETGFATTPPTLVYSVCHSWLGVAGGILALLGVVAAPITSGDTAFRSARLIIADTLHLPQRSLTRRLVIALPMFAGAAAILMWQITNPDGFNIIWKYFGWSNQTLATICLWTFTVWLTQSRRFWAITLVPAVFMTAVTVTFFCQSDIILGLPAGISLAIGLTAAAAALAAWIVYRHKLNSKI